MSLHTFLKKFPSVSDVLFRSEDKRIVSAKELKEVISFEMKERSEENIRAKQYLLKYIDELESSAEG